MLDRYSDDARQVLFFARYEASLLGSTALEADHLWLGLIRQNKKLIKRLAPKLTPEILHARLAANGHAGERASMTVEIPLSEGLGLAMVKAVALADAHRSKYVTPQHLALGLLQDETAATEG